MHPPAQGTAVRIVAAEADPAAKVWVALPAKLTLTAGLSRINSNARARNDRLKTPVEGIGATVFYHTRELVAENERVPDSGISDAGISVRVKVTATYSRD